jgi:hypothetical protein
MTASKSIKVYLLTRAGDDLLMIDRERSNDN